MNDETIELGFHIIWKIMEIEEGVDSTLLDLHNSSDHTQPHPILLIISQFTEGCLYH